MMRWFSSNQIGLLLWTCPVQAQIWQEWIMTGLFAAVPKMTWHRTHVATDRADTTLKYPSFDLYWRHDEMVQQQPDRPFVVNMPSSGPELTKMDCDFPSAAVSKLAWQDSHGYRELIPHWNILHWTSIEDMRWFSSDQIGLLLWTCPVQAQIWQQWILVTSIRRQFQNWHGKTHVATESWYHIEISFIGTLLRAWDGSAAIR